MPGAGVMADGSAPGTAPAEASPAPDWQGIVGENLMRAVGRLPTPADGARVLTVRDPQAFVEDVVARGANRRLGHRPVWVRFILPDDRAALFVLSAPNPLDGMDLTVVSHRMPFTRGLIRDVAAWCFLVVSLQRVTVRVPAGRTDLGDYARRLGFVLDGVDQAGEQVWSMSARACPWLPRRACPAPPVAMPPPLSLKVH